MRKFYAILIMLIVVMATGTVYAENEEPKSYTMYSHVSSDTGVTTEVSGVSYMVMEGAGVKRSSNMTVFNTRGRSGPIWALQAVAAVNGKSGITPSQAQVVAGGDLDNLNYSIFMEFSLGNDFTNCERVYFNYDTLISGNSTYVVTIKSPGYYTHARAGFVTGATPFDSFKFRLVGGIADKAWPISPSIAIGDATDYQVNVNSGVSSVAVTDVPNGTKTVLFTYSGDGVAYITWDGVAPEVGKGTEIGSGYLTGIELSAFDAKNVQIKGGSGVTIIAQPMR